MQAGRPFHPTDVFLHRRAKPAKSTDGSVPVFSARPRMATLSLSHCLSFVHYGSVSFFSFFSSFFPTFHPPILFPRAGTGPVWGFERMIASPERRSHPAHQASGGESYSRKESRASEERERSHEPQGLIWGGKLVLQTDKGTVL